MVENLGAEPVHTDQVDEDPIAEDLNVDDLVTGAERRNGLVKWR